MKEKKKKRKILSNVKSGMVFHELFLVLKSDIWL